MARPTVHPRRGPAGVAIAASVVVHVGLFLGFALLSRGDAPGPEAAPVPIDLVVIMGDCAEPRPQPSPVIVIEPPPFSPATARIDDGPPVESTSPSEPAPIVRGTPGTSLTPGTGTSVADTIFPAAGTGRTVVYVLDRSASMGYHNGFRRARAELLASLARLPASTHFQVIAYNRVAEPLAIHGQAGMLPTDRETVAEVARILEGLHAVGGTDHGKALHRGLELKPDVLYFVTDADELHDDEVTAMTRLNAGRTSIHVIELSEHDEESPDNLLRRLATQNRGTYRRVAVRS